MSDISAPSTEVQPQGPGENPLEHYTRVFCRFLQLVFATFPKGSYHWSPDPLVSDIIIQDQGTIEDEVVEKRPAIIISRGQAAFGNLAMDQFAGPHFNRDGAYEPNADPMSGTRRFTDLVSCSMTFNCLSSEGLEAQRLAWTSMMATKRLKRTLMRAGIHRVGEEMQVGAESAPGAIVQGDTNEIIMVSVSVPFYFQDFWSISPVDKVLLKNIDVAVRSEVRFPAEVQPPSIHGRVLQDVKVVSLDQRIQVTNRSPKPRK